MHTGNRLDPFGNSFGKLAGGSCAAVIQNEKLKHTGIPKVRQVLYPPMNSTLSPDELTPLQGFFASARDIARFVGCRIREERLAQVAASLTYTTTLSLVPLVTIILAVFTALPVFGHIEDSLHTFLLRNLMPVNISDSIFHYLNQFAVKARGLTLVGLFFLTVTAVATMLTVDRALNKIWHVRRARPLYQRILVY